MFRPLGNLKFHSYNVSAFEFVSQEQFVNSDLSVSTFSCTIVVAGFLSPLLGTLAGRQSDELSRPKTFKL